MSPEPTPRVKKRPLEVKTYIVLQRNHLGDNPVVIRAVRLTVAAAQKIVDDTPGTWFERFVATKSPVL